MSFLFMFKLIILTFWLSFSNLLITFLFLWLLSCYFSYRLLLLFLFLMRIIFFFFHDFFFLLKFANLVGLFCFLLRILCLNLGTILTFFWICKYLWNGLWIGFNQLGSFSCWLLIFLRLILSRFVILLRVSIVVPVIVPIIICIRSLFSIALVITSLIVVFLIVLPFFKLLSLLLVSVMPFLISFFFIISFFPVSLLILSFFFWLIVYSALIRLNFWNLISDLAFINVFNCLLGVSTGNSE